MAMYISECALTEWAAHAQRIKSDTMPKVISPDQNLFSSLQFINDEVAALKRQTAYRLSVDNVGMAWASVYYLSPSVLRLRGLIVLPEHQRKNYMTILLRHIINSYQGRADSILSFSTDEAKAFHTKFGFKKVEGFEPRPVEHYDAANNKYTCNPNALLTLYSYLL